MTRKKPTLSEQVENLKEAVVTEANNREMLEEALSVLESQLIEQGWNRLFGETKELSKPALDTLYDLGRTYWLKNPLIRRAVEVQGMYIFGQGMSQKSTCPEVDEVIQRFINDRKNYSSFTGHQAWVQNERDLQLAGNLFFALFTSPTTGRVTIRAIPLYEITDIVCNPEDLKEPWYYKREYQQTTTNPENGLVDVKTHITYYPDWKYTPTDMPDEFAGKPVEWAAPVYHVKTNCLPDMKFGVSEIYSAIDWAGAYKKFLENWSKLTEAYARFAWNMTTKGGLQKVNAAKAKIERLVGKTDPNATTDIESSLQTTRLPVASTFVSGESVQLTPVRTQGATTSSEDSRRLMLMVASSSGIPEQILTGDPSTGNLATAKAMERPLELQFTNRQTLWKDVWWDILQYVIDRAILTGHLPGYELEDPYTEEVRVMLDIDGVDPVTRDVVIEFPPLLEHDITQTVQAIVTAATLDNKTLAGTMDRKTMARLLLQALNADDVEEILEKLPEEPQYDRITAPPAQDQGQDMHGYGADPLEYTTASIENLMMDTIKDMRDAAREVRKAPFEEADEEGKWVTINGTHILIKDGETAGQAFERTTGKKLDAGGEKPKEGGVPTERAKRAVIPNPLYDDVKDKLPLDYKTGTSSEEIKSVGKYFSENVPGGYEDIKTALRSGDIPPEMQKDIDNIDAVMQRSALKSDVNLFRGVDEQTAEKILSTGIHNDKSFQSTSVNMNRPLSFAQDGAKEYNNVLVIHGKSGDKGINAGNAWGEAEVLLDRNQTYTLAGVKIADEMHGQVPSGATGKYMVRNGKPIRLLILDRKAPLKESDDEGNWVTISGNHVLIGKDGTIKSGFGKGKTPEQAFGKGAGGGKEQGKPPATNRLQGDELDKVYDNFENKHPQARLSGAEYADKESLTTITTQFASIEEKYPEGKVSGISFDSISDREGKMLAATNEYNEIIFNTDHFSGSKEDTINTIRESQDRGWMVKTHDPVGGILAHEYGHAYYQEMYKDELMRPKLDELAKTPFTKDQLSEYAFTSREEAFAEGFAALNYGSSRETLTSEYVKKQRELIQEFKKSEYRVKRGV